jgi:Yip1 domain
MSLITRAKNILLTPATEWGVIASETETPQSLLIKYVIPMALIPAVAMFIGFGLFGGFGAGLFEWGIMMAIESLVGSIVGYYLSTYIIDALAPNFGSEKNIGRSAQLVAYSNTAVWVAGILYIIPRLHILALLAGLYGIYLIYLGIPAMKKTPEDKRIGYLLVSIVVIIVIMYVVGLLLATLIGSIMGYPYGLGDGLLRGM